MKNITPKRRIAIYEHMLKSIETGEHDFMCWAGRNATLHVLGKYDRFNTREDFPEFWKHRPKENSIYVWRVDIPMSSPQFKQFRVDILKSIIKELKGEGYE